MEEQQRRKYKHEEISDALRPELEVMAPGARFYSESQLLERFGSNLMTIRRALLTLQLEGLLVRQQGKGTFRS